MSRVFALALLVGCDDGLQAIDAGDTDIEEEVDEDPPVIVHTPVEGTQTFGVDVAVEATVTDEGSSVMFVWLHYKNETDDSSTWDKLIMTAAGDIYSSTIPGESHSGGGVDYFIEAIDRAQNVAYAPEDGASDPYHFRLAE